jgi:phage terminase small subunit
MPAIRNRGRTARFLRHRDADILKFGWWREMSKPELTQKQENFCLAYIETGNASDAYRRAYSVQKMKPETVNRNAFELMQSSKISARVAELRSGIAEKSAVKEARVIEEVARIGLSDPARLFGADGALLAIHLMPADVRAAIASIEVDELEVDGKVIGRVKKVKLWDKNSALEKLMKHLGSFERDNKQKAGLFDAIPRDTLEMIEGKLRAIAGMAEQADSGSSSRVTH